MVDAAKKMFAHLKINVVVGQRFLGALLEITKKLKNGLKINLRYG